MKQMSRHGSYYYDIIAVPVIPVAIVVIILMITLLAATIACVDQGNPDEVAAYNAQVEIFNRLPASERSAYQPLLNVNLDDNGFLAPKETPQPLKAIFSEYLSFFPPIAAAIFCLACFIDYWIEKSEKYFLADLPFRTVYGWIIFVLILPFGWPFLLVSFFRMRYCIQKQSIAEQEEVRRLVAALNSENDPQSAKCDENALQLYTNFRTNGRKQQYSNKISSLYTEIADREERINHLDKEIVECRRKLNQAKAKLKQLQTSPPDQVIKEAARSEWQQILNMRGISRIEFSKGCHRDDQQTMRVSIHVRVPYNGDLYDFGDYEATFNPNGFSCRQLRSGIRPDHTNLQPTYPDDDYGFCFGPQLIDIQSHAKNFQFVEALTLIIDSLHSVHYSDEKYIPECYRKITTLKPTKIP